MDSRTQVQPAQAPDRLPVPVNDTGALEAFKRSPTLIAGQVPGSQGKVRIWAPDRKKLWKACIGCGLGSAACILGGAFLKHFPVNFSAVLLVGFFFAARALRRPCYLTTDDAGIGITTRRSSRSLRWNEIIEAHNSGKAHQYDYPKIRLLAPEAVEINLTGYPQTQQGQIIDLIINRAGLRAHPARKHLLVHPDRLRPVVESLLGDGDEDLRELVTAARWKAAINLYRKRYGASRKAAIAALDGVNLHLQLVSATALVHARIPDDELRARLRSLVKGGHTAKAIKLYRKNTQADLEEATDTINLLARLPRDTPAVPAIAEN